MNITNTARQTSSTRAALPVRAIESIPAFGTIQIVGIKHVFAMMNSISSVQDVTLMTSSFVGSSHVAHTGLGKSVCRESFMPSMSWQPHGAGMIRYKTR